MAHSRRDFLKGTLSAISLSMVAPKLLVGSKGSSAFAQANTNKKILVVIQLDGGNDGLNTVVPYTDQTYYAARPTLAIPENTVLKASEKYGFHPGMTKFKALFDQGRVAVIHNTGYPEPDLSHFRSRIIYHRADPTTQESNDELGWLGKYSDLNIAGDGNPLAVINLGNSLAKSLVSDKTPVSSIQDFQLYQFLTDAKYTADRNNQINAFNKSYGAKSTDSDFLYIEQTGLDALSSSGDLQNGIKNYTPTINYPQSRLGVQLQMTAQLIAAGLGTEIIHTVTNGFDTHSGQKEDQEALLTDISDSIDAFYADLSRLGRANDVLIMAFSEFGRRVRENGSLGTDHCTSGPMFVIGNAVKGGFYGDSPSLTNLDRSGNTIFNIDFRSVYSTILSDWLSTDPRTVLGSDFENIGFVTR